jgi:hypothetical protein
VRRLCHLDLDLDRDLDPRLHAPTAARLVTPSHGGTRTGTTPDCPSPDDAMSTPVPLAGRLVALRTKDEVRASLETYSAYVVEVPAKFANVVKE